MTAYAGGNTNAKVTLDAAFESSVKVIDTALGMFDGSPTTIESVLDIRGHEAGGRHRPRAARANSIDGLFDQVAALKTAAADGLR